MTDERENGANEEEGTYEYRRAENRWIKINEEGDLCRDIERPRKMYRLCYPGVAARALPAMHIGPCCERCAEEYRERIMMGGTGAVWDNAPIPPSAIKKLGD